MKKKGLGIPGISEKKLQKRASDIVDNRRALIAKELKEKKEQREFKEASRHEGMDKGDLVRSAHSRR